MILEPDDISADSLKMLWYVGLYPTKRNTIFFVTNVSVFCAFLGLAIKGILISYNTDMFFTTDCLQTCVFAVHIIGKLLFLHTHKIKILKFLNKKSNFLKITHCGSDLQTECSNIFKIVRFITRSFFMSALTTAMIFNLQPFMNGYLPIACYVPEGWFNYLTGVLWYLSIVTVLLLPGMDLFFCSLVSTVIVQFKLLAFKFKNLTKLYGSSEKKLWEELKILVDYHNVLLSYCEELNMIFRSLFLLQFGISIASCGVSVFIFMQPGSLAYRIKCMQYFLLVLVETGFYCVPLEIAINTVRAIDNAVYDSRWYEVSIRQFKKCLALVINRTQKPLIFSGYGLIYMNLRTYVTIMKTVFSFYTYLQTVEKLSKK